MKKINIAQLIKDCPKGMELYSPLCGDCKLYDVNDYTIRIETPNKDTLISLYHDGRYCINGEIMLFPKGKTTWEGFVPPCQFKDGDILSYQCTGFRNRSIYIYRHHHTMNTSYYVALGGDLEFMVNPKEGCALSGYNTTARLATEEEKAKLFQAIKDNGYKWNAETKTLEKLTPNKFDINTLVPFESKVLIRNNSFNKWCPAIWGFYDSDSKDYQYKLVGVIARYCIPYEGNEHLLGTTDDCDGYFKI